MNQDTIQSKVEMLIRTPVAEVFEAFVNPGITSKFRFTNGSGRLEAGKQVQWNWEIYDLSIPVTAQAIEPNKRIRIEWPGYVHRGGMGVRAATGRPNLRQYHGIRLYWHG
jgi:uncharacterized protein YndB with AHSA1/START domain